MIKRILKIVAIILIILLAAAVFIYFKYLKPIPPPISAEDRAAISMMPLPSSLALSGGRFALTNEFGAAIQGPADDVVSKAVNRFVTRTATTTKNEVQPDGKGLTITYRKAVEAIQPMAPDESYRLSIDSDEIKLEAATGYGVLRGLESLTQLMKEENGNYYWPNLELTDAPRFAWRGLMIDVCRHWIPKDAILRNIEAMAAVKLNVLHLHLSDYQGFRVESKIFPKLHEAGSEGNYYSQEDIKEIVQFARERGVRIVPEFDMPGHTTSFLVGYPELGSAPGPYKLETAFGLLKPVMDPSREEVYNFIDAFVEEMTQLFPDSYYHIGGDEVDYSQWTKNESIQQFMKQNAIENTHDLQAYFNQRLEKILQKHGRKMMGWDEILNPKLSNDIVVQSWRGHKSLFETVQRGNKGVLSTGYYLDYKLPAGKHYGVDPEVLPGAITIRPDSLHWQQYDLAIEVSESPIHSSLVLYGEDKSRGLFFMMENATGFEQATFTGKDLKLSFKSDFGVIDVESEFDGDSLHGKMSLGLLSFPFKGEKIGGNDWPGTIAPKVEQMKPLTAEQKHNILGGEAAMWTEVVSMQNIDSRVWPRMAAMAEKWWSPQELTKDVKDMYRRLETTSIYLDQLGLRHLKGQEEMISNLAEGKDVRPVSTLIEVLEEVKYASRIMGITTLTPLNEVADAASPESLAALHFQWMTDEFIADPTHTKNVSEIRASLTKWRNNHAAFEEVAAGNVRLEKVILTSQELSMMSNFALQAVDAIVGKTKLNVADKEAMRNALSKVPENREGTILAVAPALRKLIESIPEK